MTRFIVVLFIIWRVSLFIISYASLDILPTFGDRFPYWQELLASTSYPAWLWSWGNFDGVHYLTIAKLGYEAQFTQVFFPLYPILIHAVSFLIGGHFMFSGLFLSNIFTLIFLLLFAHLLQTDGIKEETIRWIMLFTLVFPFSFFLGAIYNESLFLSLVLGSFYLARKKQWFLSSLLGALASSTRFVGIFLLPALLIEMLNQNNYKLQITNYKFIWLFLTPLGLFTYMWYLNSSFGDPFYFIHAQPVFGAQRTGGEIIIFPQVVWRYIKILSTVPVNHYDFWVAVWEFASVSLFLIFFVLFWRKIRLSYLAFSLLSVIVPTLTGTFSSMPRYILVAFPFFIIHGSLSQKTVRLILAAIYGLLLIIFTTLFTRGYWVS